MQAVRLFQICCALACVLASQFLTATTCFSADDYRRTWNSASGKFSIEASMVRSTEDAVFLKSDSRDPIEVPLKELSEIDQKFVKGVEIIERDQAQFDLVMPHEGRYIESPMAVVEIVEEISKQFPDSPYASMMTGLAYATGMGDYKKADRYFKKARSTIQDAQNILGDGFHEQTEKSIYNNLAISALKARKGNTAVKHLAAATTDSQIPFSIYHNATLLMEVTRERGNYIKFNGDNRNKLVGLLARKAPASPSGKVPSRFLYSLKWNEPISIEQLDRFLQAGGKFIPTATSKSNYLGGAVFSTEKQLSDRGYVAYCSGSGFLISPSLMITNRHVVQSSDNSLSYTITQYREDGKPRLVGGSIVKWSAVAEEDLALIKLDQPMNAPALPLNTADLKDRQSITIIGFPEIDKRGEHLAASSGSFIRYHAEWPWFYSSNQITFGNSGGPAVDLNGNVVGIAFKKRNYAKYKLIGKHWLEIQFMNEAISISNKTLKEFLKVAAPDFVLPEMRQTPYPSQQELVEDVRGSIMLVKSWIPPTSVVKKNSENRSELAQLKLMKLANLNEKRLFPDLICMRCSGNGYVDCPNRQCHRGRVSRRTTRQTGTDPIHGTPILQSNTVYDECRVCDGNGRGVCPDCDKGRLTLA